MVFSFYKVTVWRKETYNNSQEYLCTRESLDHKEELVFLKAH